MPAHADLAGLQPSQPDARGLASSSRSTYEPAFLQSAFPPSARRSDDGAYHATVRPGTAFMRPGALCIGSKPMRVSAGPGTQSEPKFALQDMGPSPQTKVLTTPNGSSIRVTLFSTRAESCPGYEPPQQASKTLPQLLSFTSLIDRQATDLGTVPRATITDEEAPSQASCKAGGSTSLFSTPSRVLTIGAGGSIFSPVSTSAASPSDSASPAPSLMSNWSLTSPAPPAQASAAAETSSKARASNRARKHPILSMQIPQCKSGPQQQIADQRRLAYSLSMQGHRDYVRHQHSDQQQQQLTQQASLGYGEQAIRQPYLKRQPQFSEPLSQDGVGTIRAPTQQVVQPGQHQQALSRAQSLPSGSRSASPHMYVSSVPSGPMAAAQQRQPVVITPFSLVQLQAANYPVATVQPLFTAPDADHDQAAGVVESARLRGQEGDALGAPRGSHSGMSRAARAVMYAAAYPNHQPEQIEQERSSAPAALMMQQRHFQRLQSGRLASLGSVEQEEQLAAAGVLLEQQQAAQRSRQLTRQLGRRGMSLEPGALPESQFPAFTEHSQSDGILQQPCERSSAPLLPPVPPGQLPAQRNPRTLSLAADLIADSGPGREGHGGRVSNSGDESRRSKLIGLQAKGCSCG